VLGDVVGGEGDVAVSAPVGHGQGPVGGDSGDGPGVAVADRFPAGRGEATVVAAGGDDVTDVGDLAAGDGDHQVTAQLTIGESGCLDCPVDGVDVVVARRHQRDRVAVVVIFEPGSCHVIEVLLEGAGVDPVVGLVGVEGAGITGAQRQRCGRFPVVGEAV
jgi:hypothetical protein